MSLATLHTIPAIDQSAVRRMLKLKPSDPLPEKFLVLYRAHRNLKCRMSTNPMNVDALACLLLMAGLSAEAPTPPTIFELWRDRKILKGEKVTYQFRDDKDEKAKKQTLTGRLAGVDPRHKKVMVKDDATGRTRTVPVDDVSLVEAEPAQTAGV